MLPKHGMNPKKFLVPFLTCSQIGLSPLVDDCQPTHRPYKIEGKRKTLVKVPLTPFTHTMNPIVTFENI